MRHPDVSTHIAARGRPVPPTGSAPPSLRAGHRRARGIGRLRDLSAVVLEVDSRFSVSAAKDAGDDTLKDVIRS